MDKGEQETELKKERSDLLFAEEREDKERRRQSKKGGRVKCVKSLEKRLQARRQWRVCV